MTGQYEMLLEQNPDVPVPDGAILHANVYRPNANGRFPVLMTFGPYGKDVPLREFMQEGGRSRNLADGSRAARGIAP